MLDCEVKFTLVVGFRVDDARVKFTDQDRQTRAFECPIIIPDDTARAHGSPSRTLTPSHYLQQDPVPFSLLLGALALTRHATTMITSSRVGIFARSIRPQWQRYAHKSSKGGRERQRKAARKLEEQERLERLSGRPKDSPAPYKTCVSASDLSLS